jgi:serine protease
MRSKAFGLVVVCLLLLGLYSGSALAWYPNDQYFRWQWGMHAIGMERAWDFNQGGRPDVKVAVVDTGVDYHIDDLEFANFDLANAWDYVDDDPDPHDENDHGTHITGTIAQSTNNIRARVGIAFNTTILPIRVLDENAVGSSDDISAGIYRAVDAGADIINLSLGSQSPLGLYDACEYAKQQGVLVVAAAGNSYPDYRRPAYPARYDNTLVVGAIQEDLTSYYPSQFAWDDNGPGLVAPGRYIAQQVDDPHDPYARAIVSSKSGTSMAAAFVSGVAALVLAEAFDLGIAIPGEDESRVSWLRDILFRTAQDLGNYGDDYVFGHGLVRADSALQYLQGITPPPAPTPEPSNPGTSPEPDPEPEEPSPVRRPTHDDDGR